MEADKIGVDMTIVPGFRRAAFAGLGWCAVGLAFLGVFVPGLPTTVFVIAASYLFARSSPRFEAWLLANRWLGPCLRRFRESGGMTRPAKSAAIGSMWTAISVSSLILLKVNAWAALGAIALGVIGTLTILFYVRTVPAAT